MTSNHNREVIDAEYRDINWEREMIERSETLPAIRKHPDVVTDESYNGRILTGTLSPSEHSIVYDSMFPMKHDTKNDEWSINDKDATFKYDAMADFLIEHLDIKVFASREKPAMPKRVVMRTDGRYVNASTVLPMIITYLSNKKVKEGNVNNVLFGISNDVGTRTYFEDMAINRRCANFANGVVDISGDGTVFRGHTNDDVFFTRVPFDYPVDGGECPVFQEFLDYALDPKYHKFIYEWIGYCFFETYEFQHIVFHHGIGGSGKSTLLKMVSAVLGAPNVSVVSLKHMAKEKFSLNQLDGSMANHGSEVSYKDMKDGVEILKQLSSGVDPVLVEQKYEKAYPIINTAKLSFAMNDLPKTYREDSGLHRRLILIEWLRVMPPDVGRRFNDTAVGMFTPDEIRGVTYAAINAFHAMVKRGGDFSYAPPPDEVEREYAIKSAPLDEFIFDCVENSPIHDAAYRDGAPDWVSTADLFGAYVAWCGERGANPVSVGAFNCKNGIASALRDTTATKAREIYGGAQKNGYRDIKLVALIDESVQGTI